MCSYSYNNYQQQQQKKDHSIIFIHSYAYISYAYFHLLQLISDMPPLQLELTLLGGDITMILLFLTGSMHKLLVILYATSLLSCLPTAVQLALQLTYHCYCLSLPRVCHHSIRCQSVATPASGCCCLSLTRQTGHNLETMN